MTMATTHKRAIVGFLVAPLVGVGAWWLLLVFFDQPHDASRVPLYILFVYMPFFVLPVYAAMWIVGIPAYLLLYRLRRLRPSYFVALVAATGAIITALLWDRSRRPEATVLILIGALTGAATGAAFARFLFPSRVPPDGAASSP